MLRGWNLTLEEGERVALIGPSGCGKTTFLRALTGLVSPSEGDVLRNASRVGYVFQEPRLIPWLDAERNLRLVSDKDPADLLSRLRLSGAERLRPHEMSGGMRQRLNLARALLAGPYPSPCLASRVDASTGLLRAQARRSIGPASWPGLACPLGCLSSDRRSG